MFSARDHDKKRIKIQTGKNMKTGSSQLIREAIQKIYLYSPSFHLVFFVSLLVSSVLPVSCFLLADGDFISRSDHEE